MVNAMWGAAFSRDRKGVVATEGIGLEPSWERQGTTVSGKAYKVTMY